jgi:hypothetical protein
VTFIQAIISRSLSESCISSIPRVIGPPASLEPDEKYAWDPSSLISPIYNPTDGGHQTASSDEPNTKRTSLSPSVDAASQLRTSEEPTPNTFYPTYLTRPLRPLGHGLVTGKPYLHSQQVVGVAYSFLTHLNSLSTTQPMSVRYGLERTGKPGDIRRRRLRHRYLDPTWRRSQLCRPLH